MAVERFSASLVSQLALPGIVQSPQGYYRSKLFVAPFSTNSLVAAAGPVLSLLERLCVSHVLPPVNRLRDNLEHELKAFRSRIEGRSHSEEVDALAYYLLCATIDELLGKSFIRLHGKPAEFCAFTPPSHDQIGPEQRFFDIVDYVKERPNQYLDLLELAYYCLIAGFEGRQHEQADGRQVLDNLLEELYQLIQNYRVNKSYDLFKEPQKHQADPAHRKHALSICLVSISLLAAGYFLSASLLEGKVKTVQSGHQIIARLDY